MKTRNISCALVLSAASLFVGCSKFDVPETSLNVVPSSKTIKVGETFKFNITTDANQTIIYTGDAGHNYLKSADYVALSNPADSLLSKVFRTPDPMVQRFSFTAESDTDIADHSKLYYETTEPTDYELVDDAEALAAYADLYKMDPEVVGTKTLRMKIYPVEWSKVVKIFPQVGVADNKRLTTVIRFEDNNLYKNVAGQWVPGSTKPGFRVVTEVHGRLADGTVTTLFNQGSPNSLWQANMIMPKDTYFRHVVDLGKWIKNWEAKYSTKIQKVESVVMKFVGDNNAAYSGNIYIHSVELGEDGYFAFDKGVVHASPFDRSTSTFEYKYTTPGKYEATFVAFNSSNKNYSDDGYQSGFYRVSKDEYKYGVKYVTVPITVVE